MRTTIDLPDSLVKTAMKLSHHRTKTSVIITALEEFIRRNRIQELKKFRGKVDLSLDLSVSRKRQ
ncbi:MAG: type II toxin-antitoxin system VapB family antitoxin [Chitinispirillaceae bacterium]|nr:type II toxin-antitoxin system VapB family antitoxin [Chitinispirillaceae bacterium]